VQLLITFGKAARRDLTSLLMVETADRKAVRRQGMTGGASGLRLTASSTRRAAASTKSLWRARKSTPRMGLLTAANTKVQLKN
jgi:hypothetical protein